MAEEDKWLPRMTRAFMELDSSTHAIDTAQFAAAMEQVRAGGRVCCWVLAACVARPSSMPSAQLRRCPACCAAHADSPPAPVQVLPIFEKIGTVFLFARHEFAVKVRCGGGRCRRPGCSSCC